MHGWTYHNLQQNVWTQSHKCEKVTPFELGEFRSDWLASKCTYQCVIQTYFHDFNNQYEMDTNVVISTKHMLPRIEWWILFQLWHHGFVFKYKCTTHKKTSNMGSARKIANIAWFIIQCLLACKMLALCVLLAYMWSPWN